MKITKSKLIKIIKEEIEKHVKENYRDAADDSMADTVPHSWLNHGKLSSTLQERYGITEENAIGEVLWHSLNESGEIGVYDMKFGDTIIRNLTEADIEDGVLKEHGDPKKSGAGKRDAKDVSPKHGVQKDDDPKRRKRKK